MGYGCERSLSVLTRFLGVGRACREPEIPSVAACLPLAWRGAIPSSDPFQLDSRAIEAACNAAARHGFERACGEHSR